MNRHYDTLAYRAKVALLRSRVPGIAIFADVIAGFPTESEADFEETFSFIKSLCLAGLHVFSYSPRPKTKAALLPQLPHEEIKRRADKLRELDKQLRAAEAASLIGTRQEVFIETWHEGWVKGVTSNFQQVLLRGAPQGAKGLVTAEIEQAQEGVCLGRYICRL